ncbi:MAG: FAD:protein transferase [Candidatus Saccharibacteria bacterium]|jgi:thiamine biosynthesis lipoprotein|nr:FAD:protein transferase [Candidatus Saccharibacteria bacterium]
MLQYKHTFDAIGTKWQIETAEALSRPIVNDIHAIIESYDKTYSRFRHDSTVTQMTKTAGTYAFPNDSIELVEFYRTLYNVTNGHVTPLIGSMLESAGYDAKYSMRIQEQPALPSWDDTMQWNGTTVTTTRPITLDIGAAGKGQLIDIISTLLIRNNINEYVIDASGDLIHKGLSENIVGMEHPLDPSKIIGTVVVQNSSLCASASNRRVWGGGMHHIFNPHEKQPTQDIIATWVIAKQAMIADGIATALFFTDPKKLLQSFDFHYLRMHHDGSIEYTSKFKEGLFV